MVFKDKPTIGLFAPFSDNPYATAVFRGITTACRKKEVNLRFFIGNGLDELKSGKLFNNTVYNIAGPKNIDGIILMTGSISLYLTKEEREHYFSRFTALPLVSLGVPIKGSPVVTVDNKSGMRSLIEHLIKVHNYRKIAFVTGPLTNEEAVLRFNVYKEVLEKHGIAVNPDYIGYGDFTAVCCEHIMADFYNKRRINPEAIVCSNDEMALGLYNELNKRNIKIPEDVALTGFDDDPSARYTFPPITSVKQPFFKQANAAVELLLDMILNKKIPNTVLFPAELIIRKSCGCRDHRGKQELTLVKNELFINKKTPLSQKEQDSQILFEVLKQSSSLQPTSMPVTEEELKQVYSVLRLDLSAPGKSTLFIDLLKEKLYHEQVTEEEIAGWEEVLERLFFSLKSAYPDRTFQEKADLKSSEAGLLFNEIKKLQTGRNKIKNTSKYYWPLRRRFERIGTSHTLIDFFEALKDCFDYMNITCFYLVLYRDGASSFSPKKEHQKKAALFFGYNGDETVYYPNGIDFNTAGLVPDKDFKFAFHNVYAIYSLSVKDLTYGYIIFEFNDKERGLYDIILERLCSALDSIKQFDIIENKVKERTLELEAANKKLEHLDTLKNDFTANITHELRTPLTLILSPLESILAGDLGKSLPNSDRIFKSMFTNSNRLLRLINTLLDFSKLEAGKMKLKKKKTDLNKLLHFFVTSVKPGAQSKGLALEFIPSPEEITLSIDRDLMEKAFFNLLSNAIKFSPRGGTIRIKLERKGEEILIRVIDQGIGIPPEKQLSIFERFSQVEESTSRKYEGTGIGLAFTREIILLHKGTIGVESEIGKGSTFTIRIPNGEKEKETITEDSARFQEVKEWLTAELSAEAENEEPDREKPGAAGSVSDKKNVLIVDDNSSIRDFLKSLLKKRYNIMTAENGKAALHMVETILPDLIISDVMMPGMDGLELCRILKDNQSTSGIPIILLTARMDISTRIEGLKQKADDYLLKPFNARELFARIENLLEKRRLELDLQAAANALRDEMETAKKIQSSLLPDSPEIPGFDITCYHRSSSEIGSDYYDVIRTEKKSWLLIGDVSGMGITAELVMMMVQTAVTTLLYDSPDSTPAQLLTTVNKTIKNNIRKLGREQYMPLTVFALTERGNIMFSGPHQDILVYRTQDAWPSNEAKRNDQAQDAWPSNEAKRNDQAQDAGGTVETIETRGIWLGVMEDISGMVKNDTFDMKKGDTLLLYTDGIIEALKKEQPPGQQTERFGKGGLKKILLEHGHKKAAEIKAALQDELNMYRCEDDFSFVILQRV